MEDLEGLSLEDSNIVNIGIALENFTDFATNLTSGSLAASVGAIGLMGSLRSNNLNILTSEKEIQV